MKDRIEKMLEVAVAAASEKKAESIISLDIRGISTIADFFLICNGRSTTQVKAIVDEIEEKMREAGFRLLHREGYEEARWILLDYSEVVINVFLPELREFYGLERLWRDAKLETYSGNPLDIGAEI